MAGKFDALKDAVDRALKELQKPSTMREFGEQAADMIRTRTRLGSGVEREGAPKQKLKALSETYKLQRKGKIAFFTRGRGQGRVVVPYEPESAPKLSEFTSAGKSNLTNSGQMLESIDVVSVRTGEVTVGPTGSREDGKTNAQIASYVTEQGRAFNNLSDVEQKRMRDAFSAKLSELMKRFLRK